MIARKNNTYFYGGSYQNPTWMYPNFQIQPDGSRLETVNNEVVQQNPNSCGIFCIYLPSHLIKIWCKTFSFENRIFCNHLINCNENTFDTRVNTGFDLVLFLKGSCQLITDFLFFFVSYIPNANVPSTKLLNFIG